MPFVSKSQRKFMYSQHPKIAKEFESKTPKGKKLPEHTTTLKQRVKERILKNRESK